jgi:multiple sugar transport system permease protein
MSEAQAGPLGTGGAAANPPMPQVIPEKPEGHAVASGARKAIWIVLLTGLSVLFLYPFVWLFSASFKPRQDVFDNRLIPKHFAWNFDDVARAAPVLRWLVNSLWISGLGALCVTLSSACVAFAFAYFRFPGRNVLFAILLGTLMLPPQVTLIPTYLIWNEVGKFTLAHPVLPHIGTNTQYPLWMPNLFGSAFYIFLQRQFFLGIPRELFEAARIDGDSYFSMFRRIALPLAKPALIVTFIFEVQAKWFDLMTPLIYLRDSSLFTLPVGIKTILDRFGQGGGGEGDWQIIVAATLILTLPMIIIFALFQKYFIEGIATQGRKG